MLLLPEGRAGDACESSKEKKLNYGRDLEISLRLGKITENLAEVARSQDLSDAYWLLARSPTFQYAKRKGAHYVRICFV